MTATTDVAPPTIAGYDFIRHLGSGGFSDVYLYEQQMPRRKVAIKVLRDSALAEDVRRQFTAEANAMAGLDHPHIVQVYRDELTTDGRPCLVMQFYPQPNLSVRARREHFSVSDVLAIGVQIGSAVETAHRAGVLHRDIKPANILTGQYGEPGLTDFGIAATKHDGEATDDAEGVSIPWSAPEVIFATAPADERSDVWSLGATLWHLLAGRSPFEIPGGDNSTVALMRRIQSDKPTPLTRTDVPESLERLLRQTMAKSPDARPQSSLALVRSLRAVEQELGLPLTAMVLADEEVAPQPETAAAPRAGEPGEDDGGGATRVRGPQRIEAQAAPSFAPQTPAAQPTFVPPPTPSPESDGESTVRRAAQRVSPASAPSAKSGGSESTPAHEREASTIRRPAAVEPAPPEPPRKRRTVSAGVAAGIGAVVLVVAVAAAVLLGGKSGSRAAANDDAAQRNQNALPSVSTETAPGRPVVEHHANGRYVVFSWHYTDRKRGDVSVGHMRTGGGLIDLLPTKGSSYRFGRGHRICVEVQVRRGDLQWESSWSAWSCAS